MVLCVAPSAYAMFTGCKCGPKQKLFVRRKKEFTKTDQKRDQNLCQMVGKRKHI